MVNPNYIYTHIMTNQEYVDAAEGAERRAVMRPVQIPNFAFTLPLTTVSVDRLLL